jgi:hypothetical protein
MTVLATWAQQGFGQSPDDEGAAERLNTYELGRYKSSPRVWLSTPHRCFNIFEQPITIMKYVIVTGGVMSGLGK